MNWHISSSCSKPRLSHKKSSTNHRISQSISLFNSTQNLQGLMLFGRTILQNQKEYNRIWTEKEHEKEIQDILLRKERKLITRKLSRSMDDLLIEEKPVVEDNEALSLLRETVDYLKSAQGWVKAIKQLDKGELFIFPKAISEVSDLIESIMEEHKVTNRKNAAEIKMLEAENTELNVKLRRSNELLDKATARIRELEEELKKTQLELNRRAKVILKQSKRLEEQETAYNADYTKLKEMLKQTLEDKKNYTNLSKEQSTKDGSFLKVLEKTIAIPLVDQSTNTESINLIQELNDIKSVIATPKVQLLVARMLKPEELVMVIKSSKCFYEAFTKNSAVTNHLVDQVLRTAKVKINTLKGSIEDLKSEERFNFLKDDAELVKLVDEFICKRNPIGTNLIKSLIDSRNFMYNGEIEKKESGILSGWSLSSMLGLSNKEKEPEDRGVEEIIEGEKGTTPENICITLNKAAARIGARHPEKMSKWINQLQLCFGMLFKSSIEFYVEAKKVEKVKNFLIKRLDEVKQKLLDTKKQNQDIKIALRNANEVKDIMCKKMKALDTQNLLLNAERVKNRKILSQVKNEAEENKQAAKKTIEDHKYSIKILVRKIKQMQKSLLIYESERAEYSKEFSQLNDYFFQLKDECY